MTASARVKPAVVLALDIGTSQVRAFAYDDDLVIRAGSSRPVSTYTAARRCILAVVARAACLRFRLHQGDNRGGYGRCEGARLVRDGQLFPDFLGRW